MSTNALSLEYLIRPATITTGKAPVLFMFHGYGSDEANLFPFASHLPETLTIISARAPYPLQPNGYAWYAIEFDEERGKWNDETQARDSRDKIVTFIEEACKTYDLNANNVTILGFSQGAILSYAVALSFPEKVKNVIALSGYLNENLLQKDYMDKNHSRLNFYVSHGKTDAIIPLEWAQKTPNFLKNLNINHTYEEFPMAHEIAPNNFYAFREWLARHI